MTDIEWSDFYSQTYVSVCNMPLVFSSSLFQMLNNLESSWVKYVTVYWQNQKQPLKSSQIRCDALYAEFEIAYKAFNHHFMRAKLMNG